MAILALPDGTSIATLLLFLSKSLHVSNPVVLFCFQSSTVDLATAILTNDFPHVHSKWMVINNCASPKALSTLAQLQREIPFIISVVETNKNETVAQISAMHDACPRIAQTTHLVIVNDQNAKMHRSEALFAEFAEKFVLLHILMWRSGLQLLTKRTWFKDDFFIRSGNLIHDDEYRRWSTDLAHSIPYRNVNYVLLCVPPFLIKTKGIVGGRDVTSIGGMEVDTVSLVAAQMQVLPRFFAVDFTTTTSTAQCYDCVIRDEYYEHTYFVRNMRLSSALAVEQIKKTSKDRGFQDFQLVLSNYYFINLPQIFIFRKYYLFAFSDSYIYNSLIMVSPHFSVGQVAYFRSQLYPHAFDSFVVVVPTQYQSVSKLLQSMLNNPITRIWAITIITFTVMRKFCQHFGSFGRTCRAASSTTIYFQTLGVTFGSTGQQPKNRSEAVLLLFLTLFALLSGILCSGLFFQQFTASDKTPTITTFEQLLERTDLEIVLPVWMNASLEYWQNRHGSK